LNEVDRNIINLRYFEELTYGDIAKIIGSNEGALRVRMMRLLKRLKGVMEKK